LGVCRQFIISERWLATGKGPLRQYLAMRGNPRVFRLPFGEAYDTVLFKEADALAAQMEKEGALFAMSPIGYWNPQNRQFYMNFFEAILDNWIVKLEAAEKAYDIGDLVEKLVNFGQKYFEELLDRELKHDAKTDEFHWLMKSTGQRKELDPPETEERKAERRRESAASTKIWDHAREEAGAVSNKMREPQFDVRLYLTQKLGLSSAATPEEIDEALAARTGNAPRKEATVKAK
jgi:hypothetical protein